MQAMPFPESCSSWKHLRITRCTGNMDGYWRITLEWNWHKESLMNFIVCPSWALCWLQLCNALRRLPLLLIDFFSMLLGSYSVTQLSSVQGEQCKISRHQEVIGDISGCSKLSHTKLPVCTKSTSCCAHSESQKSQKWVEEAPHLEPFTRNASFWCSSFGAPFPSR